MDEKLVSKTKPINITVQSKNVYSLNNMRFDPTQNSPPSLWKVRLNKRMSDSHSHSHSPIRYNAYSAIKFY
jgi:hypothetical protein